MIKIGLISETSEISKTSKTSEITKNSLASKKSMHEMDRPNLRKLAGDIFQVKL
jgi:hypothetical protein